MHFVAEVPTLISIPWPSLRQAISERHANQRVAELPLGFAGASSQGIRSIAAWCAHERLCLMHISVPDATRRPHLGRWAPSRGCHGLRATLQGPPAPRDAPRPAPSCSSRPGLGLAELHLICFCAQGWPRCPPRARAQRGKLTITVDSPVHVSAICPRPEGRWRHRRRTQPAQQNTTQHSTRGGRARVLGEPTRARAGRGADGRSRPTRHARGLGR
eukprot:scaffold3228_cov384-Prasinococcus_capsulatus_cf.AAC.10